MVVLTALCVRCGGGAPDPVASGAIDAAAGEDVAADEDSAGADPSDAQQAVDGVSCSLLTPGPAEPEPYHVVAPPLGELHVLDITGEPPSRALLARTLQGVVNRTQARLYLVDDEADPASGADSLEATEHWLKVYAEDHGLKEASRARLEEGLEAFKGEVSGYELASEDEPWTINAACSAAATAGAVVATASEVELLEAAGLVQLESFVGRWADAASCTAELAKAAGSSAHPALALMRPVKRRARDFQVQQGMLALGGLAGTPEWAPIKAALATLPPQRAVYGYAADDGIQELTMVSDISAVGDALVPSDSMPNLSFHLAVHPDAPARPQAPDDLDVDCEAAELNVVVGLSDGDNVVVATALYPTSRFWLSPDRGKLPIAWSITPALATLAPAVLDAYVRGVSGSDELVLMIGPGYAYGSALPNADWFYHLAFQQMERLGLRVMWLFDPLEQGTGTYSWRARAEEARACGVLDGLLDGYYPSLLVPDSPSAERVGAVPVLRAVGSYDDRPPQIADRIHELLARPRAERPRVVFYSAAAWTNDVPGLVAALLPLEAEGVRFLSASAGLRCVK